jgi:hypothetical protein
MTRRGLSSRLAEKRNIFYDEVFMDKNTLSLMMEDFQRKAEIP